jgi:Ca-activated chloride channel family protein
VPRCSSLTRTVLALAAALLPLALLAPARGADGGGRTEDVPVSTMLVLDSSGSMAEPAGGGVSKIEAARRALTDVVTSLPADAAVGMRVFGATVFSRDQPGACSDSQRVVPAGTDNRDELLAEVQRYRPYGETPIGYALQQAAEDLDPDAARTIVLVSDGLATCDPDPCEVARDLSADGVDLRIDVVGLDVDPEARAQLRCIAAAAHGDYVDARSAQEITATLSSAAERALQPFDIDGQPVSGGASDAEALALGPGTYVDRFAGDVRDRWYVLERTVPGSTVVATAAEMRPGALSRIDVQMVDPAGSPCGLTAYAAVAPLFTGTSRVASDDEEDPYSCRGPVLVHVQRPGGERAPETFGLSLVEEPPVENLPDLPTEEDTSTLVVPRAVRGRPEPVQPGSSFADAALLEPGRTYAASVVPGEVNAFRVRVGWGQSLAVRVDRPALTPAQDEVVSQAASFFAVQVMSPLRASVDDDLAALVGAGVSTPYVDDDRATTQVAGTSAVAWSNRERSSANFVAGDYYVLYGADVDSPASVELPYRITVEVRGEETGVPAYADPGHLVVGPEFSTGEDTAATAAPGTVSPTAEPAGSAGGQEGGVSPFLLVGGAVVLLGAGAAVAVGLRRRRSAGHRPADRAGPPN